MYMLQLFDADDAIQPIETRLLRDGTIRLGRDATVDWPIADPDCAISRAHCDLIAGDGALMLRVLGSNGVFDDISGERLPEADEVPVELPAALRMGRFRLVATRAPHTDMAVEGARTMMLTPPLGASIDVPGDWSDAAPLPVFVEGSLLEAFCEGAGLDASTLSSEEPTEIMRRAGAAYRQMVLGMGDLMAERDRARARYQLTRTTIGGADNNPFKWAPSQRLAIDLLLAGTSGFISGPAAIKASFRDIKRHLVATFAALQGSLRAAVDSFAPDTLDAKGAGLLKSRSAAQMEEVAARHAALDEELNGGASGALDRAFVAAYDAAERSLD